MSELSLKELLDSVGINKAFLAKLMEVSTKTVQRMGDNVSAEALVAINKYKADMTPSQSEAVPVADSPAVKTADTGYQVKEYSTGKINKITHRNIALSRIAYGRGGVSIDDIARSFGLSVFGYMAEAQNTVNHCVESGTTFIELRD